MKRKPRSRPSAARRAARALRAHLTPVCDAAGVHLGWRFNPGPSLRRSGLKSEILRGPDGCWLDLKAAAAVRDARIASARVRADAAAAPRTPAACLRETGPVTRDATLARLADAWRASSAFRQLAPATQRFYRTMLRPWLDWAGAEPAAALDAALISQRAAAWADAGVSSATTSARVRTLQALCAWAARNGRLPATPAAGLRIARAPGRVRIATDAEIASLIAAAAALGRPEVGDAVIAGLWTLQRQADVLAIDLARDLARDPETGLMTLIVRQGKTGRCAIIPVAEGSPLDRLIGGRRDGLLCPAPDGQAWNLHTFRHRFAEVRAAAARACSSVATLEYRDLRDTAITRAFRAGSSIEEIATVSGHTQASARAVMDRHYIERDSVTAARVSTRTAAWARAAGIKA